MLWLDSDAENGRFEILSSTLQVSMYEDPALDACMLGDQECLERISSSGSLLFGYDAMLFCHPSIEAL